MDTCSDIIGRKSVEITSAVMMMMKDHILTQLVMDIMEKFLEGNRLK